MSLRLNRQLLSPEELSKFLERIKLGLAVPGGIDDSVRFYLDKDFTAEGETPFTADKAIVINPNAAESGELAPKPGSPQSLTLYDVFLLLQDVYRDARDVEFQREHILTFPGKVSSQFNTLIVDAYEKHIEKHRDAIQSATTSIRDKQELLTEIAENEKAAFDALIVPQAETETATQPRRSIIIPEWLRQVEYVPLRKNWKPITELISIEDDNGFLEKAVREFRNIPVTQQERFPGVRLRTDEETLSLIVLRNYLNEWAKALLEEDRLDPSPAQHVFSDADIRAKLVLFPSKTTNSATQEDLEIVQDLDVEAVHSFKEFLLKPLAKFKAKEAAGVPAAEPVPGEDGGGDQEAPQENKPPRTDEDRKKLKDDLIEQDHYIQQEALRLQVISANFVLALNKFPLPLSPELLNSEAYRYFEREINAEIMDLLNRDPEALNDPNRRAIVVRSFLFRLMANPKFQTYTALLKENYATAEIEKQTSLTPEQKEELRKTILANLEQNQAVDVDALIQNLAARMAPETPPPIKINPANLTKEHFAEILSYYGFTTDQQKEVFDGADLLMFMRTSPQRISRFTPDQFEKIFGISLADFEGSKQAELFELLGVYLNMRRHWFEKEYNAASVTQAQDIPYNTSSLTQAEFEEYLKKRQQFRDAGLEARHFVRASMLTKTQVETYQKSGKADAAETQKAADALIEDRKEIYAQVARDIAIADEETAKQIAISAGIRFRADEFLSNAQKRNFLALIEAAADLSPFELESGIVTDSNGGFIRTPEQAEQSYRSNQKPGFSNTALSAVAGEGSALIGKAAANAILPGVAMLLPKETQKKLGGVVIVGGVAIGGGVALAIQRIGSLVSQFGVVGLGGMAGGIAGAAVASGGGPVAMLFGAMGGAAAGAGGTALLSNGGLSSGGLFGSNTPATPAETAAKALKALNGSNIAAKAVGAFRGAVTQTPAGVGVASFVGITALGTILVYNQIAVSFLPPPDSLASAGGIQNKYVTLSKTADPTNAPAPQTINYKVDLGVKDGYAITITNITDTFTAKSKDPNKKLTVSQSTDFKQYLQTLSSTGSATLEIPYSIPFDNTYQDTLITNTFQVTFSASDNGTSVPQSYSASAAVCFGDCPKPASGCWPSTGRIGQDPYGPYDHVPASQGGFGEDAFDIMAPTGTPIYAPFSGMVCARWNDGDASAGGLGNMLFLRPDVSLEGENFAFGHLSKYADNITPGSCSTGDGQGIHVNAGDLIGFIGSTGHSSGPHLHYQIGPSYNPMYPRSLLRTLVPAKDKDISVSLPVAQRQVVSCYDTNSTGVPTP